MYKRGLWVNTICIVYLASYLLFICKLICEMKFKNAVKECMRVVAEYIINYNI